MQFWLHMKTLMERVILLLLMWCAPISAVQAQSYHFRTIAGQPGVPGSADGTNSQALFNRPSELVLDSTGALYVSDTINNTIRKVVLVGNDWVVTTVAGLAGVTGSLDGANSEAHFNRPNGIAQDAAGDLFVADHYNHTIRKIAREGTNWFVSTIAGLPGVFGTDDGTNGAARFRIPTGIAADPTGRLLVVDTANFTIRMVTPIATNWVVTTIAGTPLNYDFVDGLNEAAAFNYPYSITAGPDGAFYVTDAGNQAIRQLKAVPGGWDTATIANSRGEMGSQDGPARRATFNFPNGIALDAGTNIYVADQSNHTIRKLTYSGRDWDVSTIGGLPGVHGANDGIGTNALFFMPWGVAVDPAGAIFIADTYNHTIRKGVPVITLQIAAFGNQVVVSWPISPQGFQLQSTTGLSAPAIWDVVTNGIVLVGDHYVLTNSVAADSIFYRLKR
jgi:sugar lactone lactonase YvrE